MSKSLFRTLALVIAMTSAIAFTSPVEAQGRGTVLVTAKRANIRASANEKSKVLAQVTSGMNLDLLAVQGEWFHVRVPVGGMRVEAYISKKVAKVVGPSTSAPPASFSAAASAAPPAAAVPAPSVPTAAVASPARAMSSTPPPAQPPLVRNGISVAMTTGAVGTPLAPTMLHVIEMPEKVDSLVKAAAIVPQSDSGSGGGPDATFVWTADGVAASHTVSERRPTFTATFRDLRGLNPDDFAPVIVRLTPATSGVRLVAALRGRTDEASRSDADWDVVHDLKQDIIRSDVQRIDRGSMRITPVGDLPPGQYAIVMRLATKRKVAGAMLLGQDGEGQAFSLCWDFEVR